MISLEQLKTIMPDAARMRGMTLSALRPHLNAAMAEFEVNTPARAAAFIAQLAHETGEFKWFREIWGPTPQQEKYDPPHALSAKLGNTQKGDGKKYRGAGAIQLTGKANFIKYGKALGIDLENNPALAALPETSFRVAGLFWRDKNLNARADQGDFDTITLRINGGYNGSEERRRYWVRAKKALGA